MRCPDCGADYPVKPEVIIQKEPCKCGITPDVRIARTVARTIGVAVVILVLAMGSCTAYQSYLNSTIAEKGDTIETNGTLSKPSKVTK
jgi:hypothetical protein